MSRRPSETMPFKNIENSQRQMQNLNFGRKAHFSLKNERKALMWKQNSNETYQKVDMLLSQNVFKELPGVIKPPFSERRKRMKTNEIDAFEGLFINTGNVIE